MVLGALGTDTGGFDTNPCFVVWRCWIQTHLRASVCAASSPFMELWITWEPVHTVEDGALLLQVFGYDPWIHASVKMLTSDYLRL